MPDRWPDDRPWLHRLPAWLRCLIVLVAAPLVFALFVLLDWWLGRF